MFAGFVEVSGQPDQKLQHHFLSFLNQVKWAKNVRLVRDGRDGAWRCVTIFKTKRNGLQPFVYAGAGEAVTVVTVFCLFQTIIGI